MSIAVLAMACFFTWFCHKRQEMTIALVASILWLGLSVWFFLGGDALLPLGVLANDIIAWAFFLLMFIPLLLQMNKEIQHEAHGKRWTGYGTEPKEKGPTAYEAYRSTLYNHTRRRKG